MIFSTEEFITLLRAGNYLHAISDWSEFLTQQYGESCEGFTHMDGDALSRFMLYELINHGFTKNDIRHMETIYSVVSQLPAFSQENSYMLCLFSQAVLWFQVYEEKGFLANYQWVTTDKVQILKLMKEPLSELDEQQCMDLYAQREEALESLVHWIKSEPEILSKKQKNTDEEQRRLFWQIKEGHDRITALKVILKHYANGLTKYENDNSIMKEGVIDSLRLFLKKALDCPHTREKIASFVEQIRQYNPKEWEEFYLEQICPKTILEKVIESTSYYAGQAFSFFFKPALTITGNPENKQIAP